MKIGAMISDVTTALLQQPVTEKYPFERHETPLRLRAFLHWNREDCTGCGMCSTDCPANAIDMIVIDKKAKRFVMIYHIDRCTFCSQCVHTCMKDCLEMRSDIWELAALNKETFTEYYGEKDDVEQVLAGRIKAEA